jgi:hypothetical protein
MSTAEQADPDLKGQRQHQVSPVSDSPMMARLLTALEEGEGEARALVAEVRGHRYHPPKREQILRWQSQQDFQICQEIDDPNGCNVYKDLKFPDQVYENIEKFWEERSS